jgi:hypothetical protein
LHGLLCCGGDVAVLISLLRDAKVGYCAFSVSKYIEVRLGEISHNDKFNALPAAFSLFFELELFMDKACMADRKLLYFTLHDVNIS